MIKVIAGALLDAGNLLSFGKSGGWREGLLDRGIDVTPGLRHGGLAARLASRCSGVGGGDVGFSKLFEPSSCRVAAGVDGKMTSAKMRDMQVGEQRGCRGDSVHRCFLL